MGLAYPTVNGTAYSYSNISLNIAGQEFTAFQDINYDFKNASVMIRGNSPYPLAKTVGEYTFTCDATLEFSEFSMFLAQVHAASGNIPGFAQQFFQIQVSYVNEILLPGGVVKDLVQGCRIEEIMGQMKVGSEGIFRKLTFAPLNIIYNGVPAGPTIVTPQQVSLLSLNTPGTGSGGLQT